MKKLLIWAILLSIVWNTFAATKDATSVSIFTQYLRQNIELPETGLVEQTNWYVQSFIKNDERFYQWKTTLNWWVMFPSWASGCPFDELSSWTLEEIRELNRNFIQVQLEKYQEQSKNIPSISQWYRDWLQKHVDNIDKSWSNTLCENIYQGITRQIDLDDVQRKWIRTYDYYLDDFGYKVNSNTEPLLQETTAIQSVRQEYKEQKLTWLPSTFYSATFSGNILVVSNKKDIKDISKYKGIILDQRNRAGKSLKQSFYFPFSPLNEYKNYNIYIGRHSFWKTSLYKPDYNMIDKVYVYPDTKYYINANQLR